MEVDIELSNHARDRMRERGFTVGDIRYCVANYDTHYPDPK
ncbi:MAG: DUF4258 domain-containing protein [Dehalococcoidia bacterium]